MGHRLRDASKRVLTLLLATVMVVGQFPTSALAEGEGVTIQLNGDNTTITLSNEGVYNGEELDLVVTYNNETQLTEDTDYTV